MMAEEKLKATQIRAGGIFHTEMIKIQGARLVNGKSKDKICMEKITNMIVKHNSWKEMREDIINAKEEEINKHGK